jgi:hypothetical protein
MNKLTIKNDWEYFRYFINGKEINPSDIKSIKVNNKTYKVRAKETTGSYSDMGHDATVERTSLFITVDGFEIDLSKQMDKNNSPTVEVL